MKRSNGERLILSMGAVCLVLVLLLACTVTVISVQKKTPRTNGGALPVKALASQPDLLVIIPQI